MIIGCGVGAAAGIPFSLLAILDGFLSGVMGGLMGAMLAKMLSGGLFLLLIVEFSTLFLLLTLIRGKAQIFSAKRVPPKFSSRIRGLRWNRWAFKRTFHRRK